MIEYAIVYLKKQSAEYTSIILNVSGAVNKIRSLNLLSSYWDRLKYCKTFNIKRFAKRIIPEHRCATRNFSGQGDRFVELEHFNKHFITNTIRAFLSKIKKRFSPYILDYGWINCSDNAKALNMHVHLIYSAGF